MFSFLSTTMSNNVNFLKEIMLCENIEFPLLYHKPLPHVWLKCLLKIYDFQFVFLNLVLELCCVNLKIQPTFNDEKISWLFLAVLQSNILIWWFLWGQRHLHHWLWLHHWCWWWFVKVDAALLEFVRIVLIFMWCTLWLSWQSLLQKN